VILNSANGKVPVANLGKTLMHEHLLVAFPGWEGDTETPPASRREIVDACVERVEELKSGGFGALLDPCPNDLGRDVDVLGEVAARTGFNILFATGLYMDHFAGAHWKLKLGMDPDGVRRLADMYIKEITDGVGSTGLKPAVIKVACGKAPTRLVDGGGDDDGADARTGHAHVTVHVHSWAGDGAAVAGAPVVMTAADGAIAMSTVTDADGAAALDGPDGGMVMVTSPSKNAPQVAQKTLITGVRDGDVVEVGFAAALSAETAWVDFDPPATAVTRYEAYAGCAIRQSSTHPIEVDVGTWCGDNHHVGVRADHATGAPD